MEAESNMLGTLDLSPRLKSVTEIATCLDFELPKTPKI